MDAKDIKQFGFMRVAVAVPPLTLANISANEKTILAYVKKASAQKASVVVFPELSITGYTLGDLVSQELVLRESLKTLLRIKNASAKYNILLCVGLPMRLPNKLFRPHQFPEATLGVEICEDIWTPLPPSSYQALGSATILINLSASNELVGKAQYRRQLIAQQSARTISAYLYTSSGVHESTTDTI